MKKLVYDKQEPSGELRIVIPELNIAKWISYCVNFSFNTEGEYEKMIKKFEESEAHDDSILVIVNDNSDHPFYKRSYIRLYTVNELT